MTAVVLVAPGHHLAPAPAASYARQRAEGCPAGITSAWRSSDEQAALRAKYLADPVNNAFAQPPGKSRHEAGYALDLQAAAAAWVRAHPEHGWRFTDPNEWWHAEYFAALDQRLTSLTPLTPITPPKEEDDNVWRTLVLARLKSSPHVYVGNGMTRRHVATDRELKDLQYRIQTAGGDATVHVVDNIEWLGKVI